MASIIDNRENTDKTIRIFDSFYAFNLIVNPDEFDVVYGYFTSVCATKSIAANFTVALFRISQQTQISTLVLLEYLKGNDNTDKLHMNKTICYFLNSLKTRSALYGTAQIPRPNQPVSRNILQ